MSNQSDEESPQPKPENSKEADSKQVPEILPPALEGALETAGVDVSNPQVTKAIELSASFFIARGSLPIMPPEILAQYEQDFPGLGRKLIDWTEQQRNHRQTLERQRTQGSETRMNRGQIMAGVIAVWGLTLAAAVGIWGNAWAAGVIAIVSIGGPTAAIFLARTMNGSNDKSPAGPAKSPSKAT